jgi:hypothetical protein
MQKKKLHIRLRKPRARSAGGGRGERRVGCGPSARRASSQAGGCGRVTQEARERSTRGGTSVRDGRAASGRARRGERSPTARGWPERLLIWAYMMSCVTCRERLKIPVCETVWHVHACSCRPAEAPRQTTRELVSTAQEAGGVKPATSPQSTAPPEGGPREAAHTAGGAQRPPIGVNARTGSATVCEPSLRTHRPQPKPTLTRGHPRRGGVGGGGCPVKGGHTLPLDLTAKYKAGVGQCPMP